MIGRETNANQSPIVPEQRLSGRQFTPLGQGGGAVVFEYGSSVEVTVEVEEVVDGGVNGGEFLQTAQAPEAEHCSFSSSKRQVRVLDPIVEPPPRRLKVLGSERFQRRTVRRQAIRDDCFRSTVALHQFPEEFQCGALAPALRDDRLEHFALGSTARQR
jgi:hypothetical protein